MNEDNMKVNDSDDMKSTYDFSDGVRGKHSRQLREGYTVTVYHEDGTKTIEQYDSEKNVVVLDADVRQYFPDSESVNRTLRSLIKLIPQES
ncbi:MAG: hypothetical protein M5U34_17410 [Chloroflexi bacterium]|nr:hypothetical protein [Chloroflexota bacterium]